VHERIGFARGSREALGVLARLGVSSRLVVAALALGCALAVPLRLSADVWAYAAYGALLGHGADPWAHPYRAADIAALRDPLLDAAVQAWDGSLPRDVYGPAFTLPCALLVAALRPFGTAGIILALRVAAALALLACVALASRARPRLATLLAYHPVVLWSAAEGHNDVWWLALVLAADRARDTRLRLAVLAGAAAVKAVALVPLVAALAALPRRRRLIPATAALAALVAAYAPLLWAVLAHGLDGGNGPPRISLVHAPALAAWCGSPLPLVVGGVLAAAAITALMRAWRGGDLLAGAALAGWLALPAPEPWYAVWLVPVVALAGSTPASRALLAASVTGLAAYVQDLGPGTALASPALLGGTMLALYLIPLAVALAQPAPAPPPPPAAQTAAPAPSPAPQPIATTTPAPPSPSPQPSGTPNPFTYFVTPTPGPSGAPRITEIALNDRVMHKGGWLLVRVTTTPDVVSVSARTLGKEIGIPQMSPGVFAGQEQLPSGIPSFLLNRNYDVEFVASTGDGRSTSYSIPIRLER
jgi:hypothetical protein